MLVLHQYVTVQIRQYGTVKTNAVLHQQYHLYAPFDDVVFQVHLVFHQLDDGHNEIGVAQPTKYIIENAQVFVLHPTGNAVRKRRENNAMNIRKGVFNIACHGKSVIVSSSWHTYHQIYRCGLKNAGSLFRGAYLCKGGRIA